MNDYRYDEKRKFSIDKFDCAETGEFKDRHEAIEEFTKNLEKINEYQQKLFAEGKEGIIFVFQAMDAAGKDGAVRAVLSCLSPQGVSEHSFKVPSAEENSHDYLWRFWDALPAKGSISIFNRSYYEDVLVQKVHKYYEKNKYADRIDKDTIIEKRYEQIKDFEKYLWENSIRVIKVFLNVSKDEQARRFISRIDTPKKNWKFSASDIEERAYWDEYMDAFEICINKTAKKNCPWYVVPADHKWYARLVISRIVLDELKNMDPHWPELPDDEKQKLQEYRVKLADEIGLTEETKEKKKEKIKDNKPKPSDTAVGIALKSDRQSISEKKFKKFLKKSMYADFCEKFGVSEKTQEKLGEIYLELKQEEAYMEQDNLDEVKAVYKENKKILKKELDGYGKEAEKLYKHFKKESKKLIDDYIQLVNINYSKLENEIKQYMLGYEKKVASGEKSQDDAFSEFVEQLKDAYDKHSKVSEKITVETETGLMRIFDESQKIAKVIHSDFMEIDKLGHAVEINGEEETETDRED